MTDCRVKVHLAAILATENCDRAGLHVLVVEDTLALCRIADRAHARDLHESNEGPLTQQQEGQQATDTIRAKKLLEPYGATLRQLGGGDPRGHALRFILKSGRYNSLGGREDGWGL